MDAIVSMTGRLGTDVEGRISRKGAEYAKFRLATSKRILRDGEWVDGATTWVSVRCYRQLGANVQLSLRRGQAVVVVGKLRVETWVSEAGVERESTVLEAMAVGHDLNWGVTRWCKLEKDRAEPAAGDPGSDERDPAGRATDDVPGGGDPHRVTDDLDLAGLDPDDFGTDDFAGEPAEDPLAPFVAPSRG